MAGDDRCDLVGDDVEVDHDLEDELERDDEVAHELGDLQRRADAAVVAIRMAPIATKVVKALSPSMNDDTANALGQAGAVALASLLMPMARSDSK